VKILVLTLFLVTLLSRFTQV